MTQKPSSRRTRRLPRAATVRTLLLQTLTRIDRRMRTQGALIMGALDELRAEIAASNAKAAENGTLLTEIASDMDDLIAKLANGEPGSAEVVEATAEAKALTAKLTETGEALSATAAKHTP